MLRRICLALAATLITLGAGCSLTTTVNVNKSNPENNSNTAVNNSDFVTVIQYPGQDGQSALELLRADHRVEASEQGFVTAINGVKPGNKQFWAFYVNGKQAEVGAKDYQTKTSETIEWKLEDF